MSALPSNVTPALRSMSLVRRVGGEGSALIYELHAELDIARARMGVEALLSSYQASTATKAKTLIAVSELSSNALKYGGGGVLCVSTALLLGRRRLTIVVADEGPGIQDLEWALRDQESSGGSLGLGLPGTRRLVDELIIKSPLPGLQLGAVVEAKIWMSYE